MLAAGSGGRAEPASAPHQECSINSFLRETLEPALDGGVWDAAAASTRLPTAVGARTADDLISHLLMFTVDGRPLTDDELLVDCLG
ncbi:hypothetical protein OHB41_47310 [Streptomyces sp. NBC_01571]|uniref:hypothetical protein n=1 Tax=Streptomyces sp. NBC_01571 TaxID=2975883 RepID=UPI0022556289|nr:hypothetical protein [Streptomyces sp. NBC_01571]MCX4580618.1 hypothetical protein [Streptomyces sp. NBC_01571]